jgi:hypothetical protein
MNDLNKSRRSRITDGKYLIFYSQPHTGLPALNVMTDDELFAIKSP